MSKPDLKKQTVDKPGDKFLEYTGATGRTFRDMPVVNTGDVVKVPVGKVKALLATGLFKKSNPKAVEKTAKES